MTLLQNSKQGGLFLPNIKNNVSATVMKTVYQHRDRKATKKFRKMYRYMDMIHDFGGTAEKTSINSGEAVLSISKINFL